jgi:single-strand selective monofunctional uracil DNA glycosylase
MIEAASQLRKQVSQLSFAAPVVRVYNPLDYARWSYERYLRTYAASCKQVIFLGMNPGPWGMAQTGIPFGEVAAVRDWLGIETNINKPEMEHPKRPVEGFLCQRSEVSGRRLWGLMQKRFGTAAAFSSRHFVANYCPLVFMEDSGRNRTPDKLPAEERERLFRACDACLARAVQLLQPRWLIGVGGFARSRIDALLSGWKTGTTAPQPLTILHPSPASPRANRGWDAAVIDTLTDAGVW